MTAIESFITNQFEVTVKALDDLDHEIRTGILTPQQMGTLSVSLLAVIDAAKIVRATIDKQLIDTLGDGGAVNTGTKVLTVKRGDPTVRMNAKKLLAHIAARCADLRIDPVTGEVKPPAEFARDVVEYVARLSGIDNASHKGWRAKEFAGENLHIDDYRDKEPGALKVEVK